MESWLAVLTPCVESLSHGFYTFLLIYLRARETQLPSASSLSKCPQRQEVWGRAKATSQELSRSPTIWAITCCLRRSPTAYKCHLYLLPLSHYDLNLVWKFWFGRISLYYLDFCSLLPGRSGTSYQAFLMCIHSPHLGCFYFPSDERSWKPLS